MPADLGGGARDQVALEGLGRDAVERGHPAGSPPEPLVGVVVDGDEQHDRTGSPRRRDDRPGRPPWPGARGRRGTRSGSGSRGIQPSARRGRPAEGRLRGAAHPDRDGRGRRELAVAVRPLAGDVPAGHTGAGRPRRRGARRSRRRAGAPRVVVDPGLLVLAGWLPTPTPRTMPPLGKRLEGGGLLGHRRCLSQRQLDPRRSRGWPGSVAVAATVSAIMHSREGPCQKRWSQAHRASTPSASASRQVSTSSAMGSQASDDSEESAWLVLPAVRPTGESADQDG